MVENGLRQSLTSEQDNKGQVAEMTRRWSPVTPEIGDQSRNTGICTRITLTILALFGLMMAGVMMNGMMTGARVAGPKVGNTPNDTSASSFSLGGMDVSATSSPKRFEWAKILLKTELQ